MACTRKATNCARQSPGDTLKKNGFATIAIIGIIGVSSVLVGLIHYRHAATCSIINAGCSALPAVHAIINSTTSSVPNAVADALDGLDKACPGVVAECAKGTTPSLHDLGPFLADVVDVSAWAFAQPQPRDISIPSVDWEQLNHDPIKLHTKAVK